MKWIEVFVGIIFFVGIFLFSCDQKQDRGDIPSFDYTLHSDRYKEPMLGRLNQAIEDDPDNPDLYYRRSKVYAQYQNFQQAVEDISQSLEYDRYNSGYLYYKAFLLNELGLYSEALDYGQKALYQGNRNPDVYVLLAEISTTLGDVRQSEEYTKKALNIAPHNAEVLYFDAQRDFRKGDTLTGIVKLRKAIERKPEYGASYASMAAVYINQKKEDSALVYIVKGMKAARDLEALYYYHGKVLERNGYKEAALVAYESAVAFDSAYLPGLATLGLHYYAIGEEEKAERYLERYIRRSDKNIQVNLLLADISEKRGRGEEAIYYYELVIRQDSANVNARNSLAGLYEKFRPVAIVAEPADSLESMVQDTVSGPQQHPAAPPVQDSRRGGDNQTVKREVSKPKAAVEKPVSESPVPVQEEQVPRQETPVPVNRPADSVNSSETNHASESEEGADKNKKKKKNKKQQGEQ